MTHSGIIFKDHFFGNEISREGLKYGLVDYAALAASFQHVLCNDIMPAYMDTAILENWKAYGNDDDGDNYSEVFQWYIISESGADILKDYTNEIVYYIPELDLYVWGVTHFGTAWDYVLTDIPCEREG